MRGGKLNVKKSGGGYAHFNGDSLTAKHSSVRLFLSWDVFLNC